MTIRPFRYDNDKKICMPLSDEHTYVITTSCLVPKLRYRSFNSLYCGNWRKNLKSHGELYLDLDWKLPIVEIVRAILQYVFKFQVN